MEMNPAPPQGQGVTSADIPMPPNFLENRDSTNSSLVSYKLFPVSDTSVEYHVISRLLWNSSTSISSIDQISNPDLWNRFAQTRREMFRQKSDNIQLLRQLGVDDDELSRSAHAALNFAKDPRIEATPYSDNMALLFHCTRSPENVEAIIGQGLDERLGRRVGGRLGRGIYFSDNPQKSRQYEGDTGTIFICAVLLGDCLSVDHFHRKRGLVREPEKSGRQMRNFKDRFFDSIVARPGETGDNEFVIYNRYQCCPLYRVQYSRPISKVREELARRRRTVALVEGDPYSFAAGRVSPVAWIPDSCWDNFRLPMPQQSGSSSSWPFLAQNIFKKMGVVATPTPTSGPSSLTSTSALQRRPSTKRRAPDIPVPLEECPICCEQFREWKILKCSHKLCIGCHTRIETTKTTMSGQIHTFVKCPFCQDITGIEIGDCPNGTMKAFKIKHLCAGYKYRSEGSIIIIYNVLPGTGYRRHGLKRTAYLPYNEEGKEVMGLLKTAWDRRLCFTIGTSNTTGHGNSLVWNIHHKTERSGGVQTHGYPDPGYMTRVRQELKAYGIE